MYTANCGHALDCDRWKNGCGHCPRLKFETHTFFRDGTAESWRRMKEAFDGFERDCIVTSVSPWLMERAKQSPILGKLPHRVVLNGLNPDIFHTYDPTVLQEKHQLWGKKVAFHATAHFSADPNHFKGGWYVLELAKRMPDVRFLIAGTHETGTDVPPNVTLLGRLSDQTLLAQYYAMADVTLLTSKRETFSMVAAESLCCGTPVVGFQAGGPESIALPEYSAFVAQGDLDALERAVRHALSVDPDRAAISRAGIAAYSSQAMCAAYRNVYEELLNGSGKTL